MTGRGEEGHGCYPLTIVMLTGLAGDEIWGEGAGEGGREVWGRPLTNVAVLGGWTTQTQVSVKTTGNNGAH